MPTVYQKIITINLPLRVRQKPNGVYEARFRAKGYNISVSSTDYEKLKQKFIQKLENLAKPAQAVQAVEEEPLMPKQPLFTEVAELWLKLKRSAIKQNTYGYYVQLFNANIYPAFNDYYLADIKQSQIQALINEYIDGEKYRTATKIYQTLNAVFEFAVAEELIPRSPLRALKAPKYEERNGCPLTQSEERELLKRIADSKCAPEVASALIFLLYTGIRCAELASVIIEDGFVSVVCAKVRKGFSEKRRFIPVTPMLEKWMHSFELEKLRSVRPDALTQAMKRLMPNHHLHELRHTFITRCQECGVSREVVSVWAGHAADNTQTSNVYTHFSREYMKTQAKKVIYEV